MKKIIIVTLLSLSLLLVGCNSTVSPSDSNNSINNQRPVNYQAYSIYLFDVQSNFDASNFVPDSPQIEISKTILEEEAKEQKIDLIAFEVDLQYLNTKSTIGRRATLARNYVTSYGSIMLDLDTNKVVELSFKVSDKIDTDKSVPKVTQEESYAIALKYLNHFGFDPNQGTYELVKNNLRTLGEGTSYCHNFYSFLFTKYIDGVETTDICSVGITEYGSLLYYTRGDEIDDAVINAMAIDYRRVESLANEYAENICNKISSDNIGYTLSSPCMLKLDEETYAISYGIEIIYTLAGEQFSTGISIVIPI